MALYQKITITDAGAELISGIILNGGNPLTFEAVAVGSGELVEGATPAKLTGLIQEAKRLPIETVTQQGGIITVTARLATDTITADLYHREVGVYANGVLLAYGNTGDKYDYIPAAGNNAAVQKIIRVPLAIGTMQTTFAEMDSTDLVTHAALEARVAKVVEPIVREKVTVELAEEALDEAVRVVAREVAEEVNADAYAAQVKAETAAGQALVAEANIDIAIDKALFEDGEYRTTSGTQDFTARCFEITKPVKGRVEQISIPCRSTTDAFDTMYKGTPVYLSVFEEDISGEWVHIGMSTNANYQTAGATATWDFDNLKLSGRPIRFIVVTAKTNTQFDTSLYMGARVTTSTAGAAYTESDLSTVNNYLIDVTFAGAYVEPKYTPISHPLISTLSTEDAGVKASGWITLPESPAADIGLIINRVPVSVAYAGATASAWAAAINAANCGVTATVDAINAKKINLEAITVGNKGNNIRVAVGSNSGASASGLFLSGGENPANAEKTAATLLAMARNDNASENGYRLYSESDITEIPSNVDFSRVLQGMQLFHKTKIKSAEKLFMPSVITMYETFAFCTELESIAGSMFYNCLNAFCAFKGCPKLSNIANISFSHVRYAGGAFYGCSSLVTLSALSLITLEDGHEMFYNCTSLEDIVGIYLSSLRRADNMFKGCILNLESVLHLADTINTVQSGNITIGINAELKGNAELTTALETIRGKGWTVNEEYNTKTA